MESHILFLGVVYVFMTFTSWKGSEFSEGLPVKWKNQDHIKGQHLKNVNQRQIQPDQIPSNLMTTTEKNPTSSNSKEPEVNEVEVEGTNPITPTTAPPLQEEVVDSEEEDIETTTDKSEGDNENCGNLQEEEVDEVDSSDEDSDEDPDFIPMDSSSSESESESDSRSDEEFYIS